MIKRVTYLTRSPELSPSEFRRHWQHEHGPIAARFANLASYRQNFVHQRLSPSYAKQTADVDGIVELWFDVPADDVAGRDPEVTAELTGDEPRFLSGLVGSTVSAGLPYTASRYKLWLLGEFSGPKGPLELNTHAKSLRAFVPPEVSIHTQFVTPGTPKFTRDALDASATLHSASVIVCVGDSRPSSSDLAEIGGIVTASFAEVIDVSGVFFVEETTIV